MIPPENSLFYGDDGIYRYWLHRCLDVDGNNMHGDNILFIMLNPSTAHQLVDDVEGNPNDNTISRCMNLAQLWGYGDLTVVNLFALYGGDPAALVAHENPIGEHNNAAIEWAIQEIEHVQGTVICAWGDGGTLMCRNCYVLEALNHHNLQPYCLAMTQEGHPRHPRAFPDIDNPVPYNNP